MSNVTDSSETQLRERELRLKEAELAHRREMDARSSRFQLSPWTTALIALLTTGVTASVSGMWSQRADAAKGRREIALREREQQFQIVLKATENRTPEVAAKNLLFFVDIGYLPDPDSAIRKKAAAGDVPVITSPGGRPDNPIEERVQQAQSLAAGPAVTVSGVPFQIRNHILLGADGKAVSVVRTPSVARLAEPRFIVLHYTATRTAREATDLMADSAMRASAHLVVDRDGTVTQMAPFDLATWHVGASNWNGLSGLNKYSIGIELVNRGMLSSRGGKWFDLYGGEVPAAEVVMGPIPGTTRQAAWHAFNEAQVRRTEELIRLLRAAYPSITEVLPHYQVSPNRKMDPGPAFPIQRVQRETAPAPR